MQALLEGLLPNIIPQHVQYLLVPHEGKQDLLKSIPHKLRGWREPGVRFVIVCDQDSSDCRQLKADLMKLCMEAGHAHSLVRIACQELEAWLFGDLAAVERAMGLSGLVAKQNQRRYRNPDQIVSPSKQLAKLIDGYQKVRGARAIGPLLEPGGNRSPSFQAFVRGVHRVVNSMQFNHTTT
jgi:hypothetical protein